MLRGRYMSPHSSIWRFSRTKVPPLIGIGTQTPASEAAGTVASRADPNGTLRVRTFSSVARPESYHRRWETDRHTTHSLSPSDRLLVVGSGVAGLATALVAAETYGLMVTIVCAGQRPTDCNSYWAQGGIIYRSHEPNELDLLVQDISRAGAGLCDAAAVLKVATEGPGRVRQLLLGGSDDAVTVIPNESEAEATLTAGSPFARVPFDRDTDTRALSLCLEASHSAPRILHTADHTGATLTEHLAAAALRHSRITFQPNTVVTDLIVDDASGVCVGVESLQQQQQQYGNTGAAHTADNDAKTTPTVWNRVDEWAAHGVVLAAGGLAGIYEHSTNPSGFNALGSSVALASRANVPTRDLEFVQFHPTALSWPDTAPFLLSEALRGEGAILRDASGRAFCRDYHVDGELAPRDVVARAVFDTLSKPAHQGGGKVFLDITHRDPQWVRARFPTISQHLNDMRCGLDLATNWLPIVPAAHYTCGGIATDLNGCTGLTGLYAAGEAARTGLHGGNRLASTSLLEGLVFGASVADYVGSESGLDRSRNAADAVALVKAKRAQQTAPSMSSTSSSSSSVATAAQHLLRQVRRVMWDCVGVTRTESGLNHAVDTLFQLRHEAHQLYDQAAMIETAAVRDATGAGYAVACAALANPRSVGAHCIQSETEGLVTGTDHESDDEDQALAVAR